jgi:hypothetical protein
MSVRRIETQGLAPEEAQALLGFAGYRFATSGAD